MSELKFYKIETDKYWYDEWDAFIVCAENEEEAFKLIVDEHPYIIHENFDRTKNKITITELKPTTKGILLGSFNAG